MIIGIDEAGRGPLAGPVVAAAVVLPASFAVTRPGLPALTDSKKLSPAARAAWQEILFAEAQCGTGMADVEDIETHNILQATFMAMQRAVKNLRLGSETAEIWIDGNQKPKLAGIPPTQIKCFVGGDGLHACISAASVIAKTQRDAIMQNLHTDFPQYDWYKNMGYGTAAHRAAIRVHGASPHHRPLFLRKIYERENINDNNAIAA